MITPIFTTLPVPVFLDLIPKFVVELDGTIVPYAPAAEQRFPNPNATEDGDPGDAIIERLGSTCSTTCV